MLQISPKQIHAVQLYVKQRCAKEGHSYCTEIDNVVSESVAGQVGCCTFFSNVPVVIVVLQNSVFALLSGVLKFS